MSRSASGKSWRKPIQVKLTEEERDQLDAAAVSNGMDTSTWMRAVCLSASKSKLKSRAARR